MLCQLQRFESLLWFYMGKGSGNCPSRPSMLMSTPTPPKYDPVKAMKFREDPIMVQGYDEKYGAPKWELVGPFPSRPNLYEIVITGGPCGGKDSSIPVMAQTLRQRGFIVFEVPEISTMLHDTTRRNLGAEASHHPEREIGDRLELSMISAKMELRRSYRKIAECYPDTPVILLFNRAEMDGEAYSEPETFTRLLSEIGIDRSTARDSYDAAIHLTTAAIGAEEYYQQDNETRWEDLEMAPISDAKTWDAWKGHHHAYTVDNSTDFQGKIDRTLDLILETVDRRQKEDQALENFTNPEGSLKDMTFSEYMDDWQYCQDPNCPGDHRVYRYMRIHRHDDPKIQGYMPLDGLDFDTTRWANGKRIEV